MKKRTLVLGVAFLLVVVAASFANLHSLTGSLTQGEIDFALKARADTNGDHVLSVREIRTTLIDIIRGVLAGTEGYDINDDGSVSKADISVTVASLRRLLLAHCGNGTVDAAEECDDGGTEGGDGCSAICTAETPVAASWTGSLAFIGNLPVPPTFNEGVHALRPVVVALKDQGDRAVAAWAESKLNSGSWDSPITASIVYSVFENNTWTKRTLSPEVNIETGPCPLCVAPVLAEGNGTAHLFWNTPMRDGAGVIQNYAVYASVLSGSTFVHPWYVSGVDSVRITTPGVAFNDAGQGIAAWAEFQTQTGGYIRAVHYDPETGWSPAEDVVPVVGASNGIILNGGTNALMAPAVGIDDAGNATVVYKSTTSFPDQSASGLHKAYRDDLYAVTWTPDSGWAPEVAVAKNENNWIGPSYSYAGIAYGHSVIAYTFVENPDGQGMVAFTQSDPSTKVGANDFPIRRVYAARLNAGAWSQPMNVEGALEGAENLQLAGDGSGRYLAAWSFPCTSSAICTIASYFIEGSWLSMPVDQLSTGNTPLFLAYFPPHQSFALATSVGYTSLINPEVYLQEFSEVSNQWSTPVASGTVPFYMRNAYVGSASAGLHTLFTLWSQEKHTGYQNEPQDFYMYQLDVRSGALAE